MPKTILTYGTFDLFHIGHLRLLERARSMGSRLVVGVSTDEFNREKGKKSIIPYEHRAELVGALRCVDGVFPEQSWNQKITDIGTYKISTLVMGSDWSGQFDHLSTLCNVAYLDRTDGISSTSLKTSLSPLTQDHAKDLKASIDVISQIIHSLQLD